MNSKWWWELGSKYGQKKSLDYSDSCIPYVHGCILFHHELITSVVTENPNMDLSMCTTVRLAGTNVPCLPARGSSAFQGWSGQVFLIYSSLLHKKTEIRIE